MLWNAIKNNNIYNIQVVVNANFPKETPLNALGMTAVHLACCHASGEALELLLQAGYKTDKKDNVRFEELIMKFGRLPLHFAAANNNTQAIQVLAAF